MSESGGIRGGWRGVAKIFALVFLLAVLVGLVVYQFEEKIGGFANFLGEAIAIIIVIGLIAWSSRRQA